MWKCKCRDEGPVKEVESNVGMEATVDSGAGSVGAEVFHHFPSTSTYSLFEVVASKVNGNNQLYHLS